MRWARIEKQDKKHLGSKKIDILANQPINLEAKEEHKIKSYENYTTRIMMKAFVFCNEIILQINFQYANPGMFPIVSGIKGECEIENVYKSLLQISGTELLTPL